MEQEISMAESEIPGDLNNRETPHGLMGWETCCNLLWEGKYRLERREKQETKE